MDENGTAGPKKRASGTKPAPIAPAWTATPAPNAERDRGPERAADAGGSWPTPSGLAGASAAVDTTGGATDETGSSTPAPGDTATGTPAPGDTRTSTPAPGDTATGRPAPGDTRTSTPAPGDTATGRPAPGDTRTSTPAPGDTATGRPAPGDTVTGAPVSDGTTAGTGNGTASTQQGGFGTDTPNGQLGLRAGDLDRRRVAAILHDALGKGQLTITEFDERTSAAWAARYVGELDGLTADLIPARPGLDAAHHATGTPLRDIQPPASARVTGDGGPSASVAVFSGFERKGVWTVPQKFAAVAIMGGGVIDIRHANFGAQHVTITATAIMGGIDIIVPDDVHVEVTGFAFMGGFDDVRKWDGRPTQPDPDAPRVTINGFAMMGGVSVTRKASGPVPRQRNG